MRYRNVILLGILACLLLSTMAVMKLLHTSTSAIQSAAPVVAPKVEQSAAANSSLSTTPEKPAQAEIKVAKDAPKPSEASKTVATASISTVRHIERAEPDAGIKHHRAAPKSEVNSEANKASSEIQPENQQKAEVSQDVEKIDMAQVVQTMDTKLRTCRDNLWKIEAAKEQWAKDNSKRLGDKPTMEELSAYIKKMPKCPDGGTYDINSLGVEPFCSVHKGICE